MRCFNLLPGKRQHARFFSAFSGRPGPKSGFSHFAGYLKKENSLRSLNAVFNNISLKGFSRQIMKKSTFSLLSASSRKLQSVALKNANSLFRAMWPVTEKERFPQGQRIRILSNQEFCGHRFILRLTRFGGKMRLLIVYD